MKKYIVANWKMNGSLDLLNRCLSQWQQLTIHHQAIICPPFPLLSAAKALLSHPQFSLGAQDCYHVQNGAYTGDVSASMLQDVGCKYVIVGHSERRQHHGESSQLINAKAMHALSIGLIPIICIGETLAHRNTGKTFEILEDQIKKSCPKEDHFLLAYEPIWAIGTGQTASIEDIIGTHQFLRETLGGSTPLLYGGSVNAANSHEILGLGNVDGVLVGGASLKPDDFEKILQS